MRQTISEMDCGQWFRDRDGSVFVKTEDRVSAFNAVGSNGVFVSIPTDRKYELVKNPFPEERIGLLSGVALQNELNRQWLSQMID